MRLIENKYMLGFIQKLRTKKVIDFIGPMAVFDLIILFFLFILLTKYIPIVFGRNNSTDTSQSQVKIMSISPDAGPIGTSIIIIGFGFSNDNTIVIKGKEIIQGLSSTEGGTRLNFVLPPEVPCKPPNACPLKIYVSNKQGISNAMPFKITWGPIPTTTVPTPTFTPTMTPTPTQPPIQIDTLTIRGRFIDYFSLSPIPNVPIYMTASSQGSTITSSPTGEFSITTSVSDLIPGDNTKNMKSFPYAPSCYFYDNRINIKRNDNGSLNIHSKIFDKLPDPIIFPVTSFEVNIGDVKVWPAVSLTVNSDKKVSVQISYPEENQAVGNANYLTSHGIGGGVIPFNYSLHVQLTEEGGMVYTSPDYVHDLQQGCLSRPTLNFFFGEFTWQ